MAGCLGILEQSQVRPRQPLKLLIELLIPLQSACCIISYMGKKTGKSKKRNKKYTGVNAKQPANVVRVHKVNAVVRSNFGQWVHDHRTILKYGAIVVAVIALIVAGFVALF